MRLPFSFLPLLILLAITLPAPARSAEEPAQAGAASPATPGFGTTQVVPAETKPATPAPGLKEEQTSEKKGTVRIGYVDMVRLGKETQAGKSAKAQLEKKSEKYRSQLDAKQKQLERLKESLKTKLATLSPKQRETQAKEFEKKVADFQKQVQNAEKELQSMEQDLTRKLYDQIEAAVATYGKSGDFVAIVMKKELLYLSSVVEAVDVTEEVLQLLNAAR